MTADAKRSCATHGESHSLKLLSEWATPGLWKTGFAHWGRIQICGADRTIGELNAYAGLGGREKELNAEQDANGKFICALVNAFRAGNLSVVSETAPLVAGDLKTQREIHDSYAPSAIEQKPDPIAELCKSIRNDIRLCDHGYIHITCGQCVATWLPR